MRQKIVDYLKCIYGIVYWELFRKHPLWFARRFRGKTAFEKRLSALTSAVEYETQVHNAGIRFQKQLPPYEINSERDSSSAYNKGYRDGKLAEARARNAPTKWKFANTLAGLKSQRAFFECRDNFPNDDAYRLAVNQYNARMRLFKERDAFKREEA